MKYSTKFEVHPVVLVLLILLALIGIDLAWTRQRKTQRVAAQPVAQPVKAAPPPSPFGHRQPPAREPITPERGSVLIERDETPARRSPFGSRRTNRSGTSAEERAAERIAQLNTDVFNAAKNGANAYVERQQQ